MTGIGLIERNSSPTLILAFQSRIGHVVPSFCDMERKNGDEAAHLSHAVHFPYLLQAHPLPPFEVRLFHRSLVYSYRYFHLPPVSSPPCSGQHIDRIRGPNKCLTEMRASCWPTNETRLLERVAWSKISMLAGVVVPTTSWMRNGSGAVVLDTVGHVPNTPISRISSNTIHGCGGLLFQRPDHR